MKKQERLLNKKRKIVALANIIVINENDKKKKSKKAGESEVSSETKVETIETVRLPDFVKRFGKLNFNRIF